MPKTNYQENSYHTEQHILNESFDATYGVSTVENLAFGPQGTQGAASMQRVITDSLAVAYVTDGTATYVGEAAPGTRTSDPYWRMFKFDSATGKLTYADGNANFDNIFDNYAALTY